MSNVARVASTAANTLTQPLNVEDVFSTYLYTGDSTSSRTITNGIDLSGEGGMVWFKSRTTTTFHGLFDTERGATLRVRSDSGGAEDTLASDLTAFNSDGFTLGNGGTTNTSPRDYCSWTFRKAPKFFDVVTWVGDGSASRQISHNLNSTVGAIFVKSLDASDNWVVYHKGVPSTQRMTLNSTAAASTDSSMWDNTDPTSTHFTVDTNTGINGSGKNYVAYLFAHNDGDGDFGPTGDQDIIKCGSINTSTDGTEVNLGWEPQFVIFKRSDTTSNWAVNDTMRGFGPGSWKLLNGNTTSVETEIGTDFGVTSTGFICNGFGTGEYIYIAIRRGPMAVPESATDVFDVVTRTDSGSNTQHTVGFALDAVLDMSRPTYSFNLVYDRLRGGTKYLSTNDTSAEATFDYITFDDETGKFTTKTQTSGGITFVDYVWKRAPNFFDVVAYSGNSTNGRTVTHNLNAVPEMMWVKQRGQAEDWIVYHSALGNTKAIRLNSTIAAYTDSKWNNTTPTSTVFSLDNSNIVNGSGRTYIAYLFASLDGVSKVGSYTGNGTSQTIDCGFSSGARFVLIKPTSATGHWAVFDTERGIVAGGDPYLLLNGTNAETTGFDELDPDNSGFIVNNSAGIANVSGVSYIFYAIA